MYTGNETFPDALCVLCKEELPINPVLPFKHRDNHHHEYKEKILIFPRVALRHWQTITVLQAQACNTDTTPTQPHRNSNTHRTKYNTTSVVIQQNGRKLLMMDILMSETCWAHKKWNKIASDIKLVFYSSTITMMHGPINIRSYTQFGRLCHTRTVAVWQWTN
jgi:hypothetical protein